MDLNKITAHFSKLENKDLANREELEKSGENIYTIINILSQRTSQINSFIKQKVNQSLNDLIISEENLPEGELKEKRAQIVRSFEKLPKPIVTAIKEFLEDKLEYKKVEEIKS
jgi:DNA-directed RNA polymerase subunit K/omega